MLCSRKFQKDEMIGIIGVTKGANAGLEDLGDDLVDVFVDGGEIACDFVVSEDIGGGGVGFEEEGGEDCLEPSEELLEDGDGEGGSDC
ncbi:hypothetical protein V6N13_149681 [Hibiscus sabdariffa]